MTEEKIFLRTPFEYCCILQHHPVNPQILNSGHNRFTEIYFQLSFKKTRNLANIRGRSSWLVRGSPPKVSLKKGVLKTFNKFTGELSCQSVISMKLLCNFVEIALRHGCSLVNLLDIFRAHFLHIATSSHFLCCACAVKPFNSESMKALTTH